MKFIRTLLFVLLLSLGLAMVACDQVTTTPPDTNEPSEPDPNKPSEPDPSNPQTNDGLEQLIALADESGKVSATVKFETDESLVLGFESKDKSVVKFVQASFTLETRAGKSFKALGIVTLGESSAFKEGDTSFSAKGEFAFEGQIESVNTLKLIRATTSFIYGEDNQQLSVALLMMRSSDGLSEVRFENAAKGEIDIDISSGDLGSGRILAPTQLSSTWGSFTFKSEHADGSSIIGFGLTDLSNTKPQENATAKFSFVAQNRDTPYGNAHQLVGTLQSPKGAVLLFDEADAFALAIGLKIASKPSEPAPENNDGFAELTDGLANGTSVTATLNYKLSPLTSSLRDSRVETVPAEYIFTTASGKGFKGLGFINIPSELAKLSDQEIFDSVVSKEIALTATLTELTDFKVLVGVSDLSLTVEGKSFLAQANIIAFPNTVTLNTQTNQQLKNSSVSVQVHGEDVFSFIAQDEATKASFAGFGFSLEGATTLAEKATLNFFTESLKSSYGNAGDTRGFLSFEDQSVLPIIAITVGLETPKEIKTVAFCADCKEDLATVLTKEQQSVINWDAVSKVAVGIPSWIKGEEAIPFGEKATCDDMYTLFFDSAVGANLYRLYYEALSDEADLLLGKNGSTTSYKAGSKEHNEVGAYMLAAKNQSFLTVNSVINTMDKSGCFIESKTLATLGGFSEIVVVNQPPKKDSENTGWAFWFPDFTFELLPPILQFPPIELPAYPPPYKIGGTSPNDPKCTDAQAELADRGEWLAIITSFIVDAMARGDTEDIAFFSEQFAIVQKQVNAAEQAVAENCD